MIQMGQDEREDLGENLMTSDAIRTLVIQVSSIV